MDVVTAAKTRLGAGCERLPKTAAIGDLQRPWAGSKVLRGPPRPKIMHCSRSARAGREWMTAPLMRRCPSMVPMKPAAEGEVLDSLRRSLSGRDDMPRARLRRCPPAGSPTLRAVVSLFRGRFPTHRGTSRQTVRLGPEQYGHRGHESVRAPAIFCLDDPENVIQ